MKRRLYYMLPDVRSASAMRDELLLERIEKRHIHFCAKESSLPEGLPEMNFLQKTNLIYGLEFGLFIGAIAGLITGALLLLFPAEDMKINIAALSMATLGGAILGSWLSGRKAALMPNAKLNALMAGMRQGQVLLIVDAPFHRVQEIENLIARQHPEISFGGIELRFPIFS